MSRAVLRGSLEGLGDQVGDMGSQLVDVDVAKLHWRGRRRTRHRAVGVTT